MYDSTIDVDRFFQTEKEILKENLINIWQKRKTRIVQFKYIDDIHVMAIFFAY